MQTLTPDEQKLVDHAKKAVVKYNQMRHAKGSIDTLYSFILSDSGQIHDGACLEANISHANVCGERHAIANMVMQESYAAKVKCVVVADPAPEGLERCTMPCGTCRHLIWEHGSPDTTVIGLQYIGKDGVWTFPKWEKHTIKELYPYPYEPVVWDK
ncbi:MAG: hypothetical protein HQ530_05335 [Parcubacteria group bacterium]|nr:hypothetical protein [Parcubacteria group bacterium]